MSELVFIFGAGASREAGAPLMTDFLDKADGLRKGTILEEECKPDFDIVFKAISELQPIHSKSELDLDNIESVFAAFEMARLINRFPGMSDNDIDSLLVSIRRVIFKTLEKTVIYPVQDKQIRPNPSYNSLVELISHLSSSGRRGRCSIITFNYDLALDYALHFNNRPLDYCFSEETKVNYINLMKLHGSLNWGKCSKCGEIIPLSFSTFFSKFNFPLLGFSEMKSVCLDLASKLSFCGLEHCGQYVQSEPVIVPPTWNKTAYHEGLSKVWSRAASELSDAENIFVSGYSLTETDSFFRYLFALGSVGPIRIKRFWVFDPDEQNTVRPRFEKLIGSGTRPRFRFEKKKFSEAIDIIGNEFADEFESVR